MEICRIGFVGGLLMALGVAEAAADCAIDNSTPGAVSTPIGAHVPSYERIGQSFTACQDGEIVQVTFWTTAGSDSGTAVLELLPGPDNGVQYNPVYLQEVAVVPGLNTFQLTAPWPVVSGETYLAVLRALTGEHQIRLGVGFGGGRLVAVFGGAVSSNPFYDLMFRVEVSDAVPVRDITWGALKARESLP
jgi:hypothetical protein